LENNVDQYRVRVRFEDPDRLPIHFQSQNYLSGSIIATVPGPSEINWILRLDEPLSCHDVKSQQYIATTFLLKPNGLDSESAMVHAPWEKISRCEIVTIALLVDDHDYPKHIGKPEDYRNYPLISDARVLLDK